MYKNYSNKVIDNYNNKNKLDEYCVGDELKRSVREKREKEKKIKNKEK